jgi:hypothetical protein
MTLKVGHVFALISLALSGAHRLVLRTTFEAESEVERGETKLLPGGFEAGFRPVERRTWEVEAVLTVGLSAR